MIMFVDQQGMGAANEGFNTMIGTTDRIDGRAFAKVFVDDGKELGMR